MAGIEVVVPCLQLPLINHIKGSRAITRLGYHDALQLWQLWEPNQEFSI